MMIASLGPGLPHDLLDATGRYAGPLGWNIDRDTPQADQWLESKFPLWSRSVLQDWADGALDHLDAVVFSRADDACQRLYYYACELRRGGALRGPEPLIADIANVVRPGSDARTEAVLRKLAARLGVDDAALEAAIARTNARRGEAVPAAPVGKVCLIAGSPPPDLRLHAFVQSAGWTAAGQTMADLWGDLGPLVGQDSGNPFAALSRQLQSRQTGPRGFFDRAAAVADQARLAGATLLWLMEEDDTTVWHLPAMRAALEGMGLPVLVATRRDWRGTDGIAGELTDFLKGISA
jgi:hypothetical protein